MFLKDWCPAQASDVVSNVLCSLFYLKKSRLPKTLVKRSLPNSSQIVGKVSLVV